MTSKTIFHQRLNQQRIARDPLDTPEAVVAWLGALQSQEYTAAKWSLGMRVENVTDAQVEQAFNEGRILRTHVLRPTWHFVLPADICWLLELTSPRVNAGNGHMYRQLELDEALFSRSNALIVQALQGGRYRTKAEIGQVLGEAGIVAEGLRLGYLLHRAELDALICSGSRRGKQHTFALIAERAPNARRMAREEALAELTLRYFSGHGPASARDFAWWSGLTMSDVKTGLQMVSAQLEGVESEGETYWFAAAHPPVVDPSQAAFLLPTYDEVLVGYSGFDQARRGGPQPAGKLVYEATIVIDGEVCGSWRRNLQKKVAQIELAPFAPLSSAQRAMLADAARRYGEFLELPVEMVE